MQMNTKLNQCKINNLNRSIASNKFEAVIKYLPTINSPSQED